MEAWRQRREDHIKDTMYTINVTMHMWRSHDVHVVLT